MSDRRHDPDSRFGALVSLLNRAARVYFTRALEPYSVGPGQQAYLLAIQPGESITQNEIVERLSIDKANVTRGVQSLVRAGYVVRQRSHQDRRSWSVGLTDEGVRVRESVVSRMQAWVTAIRSDIPRDEWSAFVATLEKVASAAMERSAEIDVGASEQD